MLSQFADENTLTRARARAPVQEPVLINALNKEASSLNVDVEKNLRSIE